MNNDLIIIGSGGHSNSVIEVGKDEIREMEEVEEETEEPDQEEQIEEIELAGLDLLRIDEKENNCN